MTKLQKINQILLWSQKKQLIKLLFIIFLVSILDLLGISIFFPILIIFSKINFSENELILFFLENFNFLNSENILVYLIILLLIVFLIKTGLGLFLNYQKYKILFKFYAELSSRLMKIYINLRYSDFIKLKISEKANTLKTEIEFFVLSVIDPFLVICLEILTIFLITLFLVIYDPNLLLGLFIFGGSIVYIITKFFGHKLKIAGKKKLILNNSLQQQINQGLLGIKDIKLSLKENLFTDKYSKIVFEQTFVASIIRFIQETPRLLIELFAIFCFVLIILVNIFSGQLLSDLIIKLGIFGAASFKILPSLNRLIVSINSIRQSHSVIDTILKDTELEKIIPTDNQENILEKDIRLIKISNLSYKYPLSNFNVIDRINLEMKLGDYIGIYGKSGSGKSTFINLFSGLLKYDQGEFLLNDSKIDVNSKSWKKNIGYVPQSIFLNNESIRENIAFGVKKENIDDTKVIEVLKKVHLYDFVNKKKDGVDTIISDNSLNLSGGQIQRIGIARALYRDPKILIFDESTNSLDLETEKEFMKAVYKLKGDKIIIFVSHKINLLKGCNKVYELKNKNLQPRVI
jgi:ABC-type multidrug transport system fused ATPase/permease subunit